MTDGKSNVGIDPVEAGYAASKFGIHIYTIGIGNTGEDPLTGFAKQSGVDEKMLSDIADRAQGQFYRAKNTVALQDIYAEIDRLEPTTAEYTEYIYKEEKAGIWIALSILGLLGYLLISETWLRRVP